MSTLLLDKTGTITLGDRQASEFVTAPEVHMHEMAESALVASLAEHILVPVRATTFDLHAMRNTVDLLRAAADNTEPAEVTCRNALGKAAIVLNGTPARPSASWRKDMMGALAQCGAGGLDVVGSLADRAAYSASIENGRGVTEEKRDPKAVEGIMELYRNVAGLERRRAAAIKKAGGRK